MTFGLAMIGVFIAIELRSAEPIMPMEIYRNRAVVASAVVSLFLGFGMYGIILFAPLFFRVVKGASATRQPGGSYPPW